MTVYHTATQEDYDALMVELESKGYKWNSDHKPTELDYFSKHKKETCVKVWEDTTITADDKSYYIQPNSINNIDIIEYKAKKKPELPEWARWIARDKDGDLWAYSEKPQKDKHSGTWGHWGGECEYVEESDNTYSFIVWEYEEPFEIKKDKTDDELAVEEMKEMGINLEEDIINKPNHYHSNGVDVIGFAEAQFSKEELKGFYRINAIKYLTRFDKKGTPLQDLEKAQFYLNKLLEGEE